MNARIIALAIAGLIAAYAVAQDTGDTKPARQVPEVLLSDQHQQMVAVGVGDAFPEVTLPTAAQPTDEGQPLAEQLGSKATVVAVFAADSAMSKAMLRDLHYDVAERYKANPGEVNTIAIGSNMQAGKAIADAEPTKYEGTLLFDDSGATFDKLGTGRMPRVYVLNADGQIEWLDIEYSQATRRELSQALTALAGKAN